ncbi:hypothetical protein C2G38_2245901 [Gigaspora rosea]|uniref:Uncharacterized protein n=1 Tax=Gigaspora rosea TaxID=44941 RepID=A0A397V856_9GLOM|nr:hypothetical protein C2G38_2245901 [Gigaspora rosea]
MDMLNENFFLESFISYINTSKPSLPRLEEFLYHTQDISKNGIHSCHKKLAHKTFFTQIQIISSLSKQSADIKCQYEYESYLDKKQLRSIKENVLVIRPLTCPEFFLNIVRWNNSQNSCILYFWADVARSEENDKSRDNVQNLMNFASGRFLLELKSCDDLVQLKDFKKLVNNMIEEHRVVIIQRTQEAQKNKIIQKWKDITRISSLFSSNSFDIFEEKFMQKNLLDSFYCMIIDLFHDSELWLKDSFENLNLQSINELQKPDISIEYFPSLNLKLSEGVYSERVKGSIIEILKLWIITWKKVEEIDEKDYVHTFIISPLEKLLGINLLRYVTIHGPEHPTYCSYEHKSFFFNFDNLEASSCKVFESVNNEGSNNLEIYSKGIMSKKKYRKKVDIAISYRVENMINDRDQYGYFYPILGEAKLSNISADSDYNKLSRALNDNYNTIINYYSKKVKGITDNLVDLFSNIRLGGIHVTAGEIYLLQYTRYPNQKFGVLADISSSKISLKFEDQQAGYMIDLLYCVKIMVQDFIKQIQKIDREIQRINESQNEEFDSKGEFLLNNILTTPTTPPVHKSD